MGYSINAPQRGRSRGRSQPSFMVGLDAYEVRALTGAYAPSGHETMEGATPSEWLASDPSTGKLAGLITGYSGGGKTIGKRLLIVHGGGHEDGANNGVYQYDLTGPGGWTVVQLSTIANTPTNAGTAYEEYTDGRPSSIHTYDGCWVDNSGAFYRATGALWRLGGFGARVWKLPNNGSWSRLTPDVTDGGVITANQACAIHDPDSDKACLLFGTQQYARFVDCADGSIGSAVNLGSGQLGGYASAAWDSQRGRALLIDSISARFVTLDFAAESGSWGSSISALAALVGRGFSIAGYDELLDCFWALGGNGTTEAWDEIHRIAGDGSGYTTHSLTGDAITYSSGQVASFGRTAFEPDWRIIATVAHHQEPVSVIKLPSV